MGSGKKQKRRGNHGRRQGEPRPPLQSDEEREERSEGKGKIISHILKFQKLAINEETDKTDKEGDKEQGSLSIYLERKISFHKVYFSSFIPGFPRLLTNNVGSAILYILHMNICSHVNT